jgi:uncharacterized protein (TIGR02466 family)
MFNLPFYLAPVAAHAATKKSVLREIKRLRQDPRAYTPTVKEQVYTDYMFAEEQSTRKYKDEVIDAIKPNLESFAQSLGAKSINFGQIWFQHYETDSYHGVHNHWPSHFSAVYFLQFDKDHHEGTVLMNPNRLQIEHYRAHGLKFPVTFSPDVKEGDLLFFPSFVDHYAPMNRSNKPRTIVSFNFDLEG